MKKYTGTEKAPEGVYLNLTTGELVQLDKKTRILPGTGETGYIKMPALLAMIIGPLVGLVFVIFLPFAGIAGFLGFAGYRLWRGITALERRTLQLGAVGWVPGRAYFLRHGAVPTKKPGTEDEAEFEELEEEITARRQRGEQ